MASLLSPQSPSRSIASLVTPRLLNSVCSLNASYIGALPEEVIVEILEWCDFGGVLACQRTCRAFSNVIEGSASLRYKLALSKNGMCDEPRCRMTAAEKLELLTAHAAAWRRLHTVRPEWATSLVGWSAPAAVSGNVLVFSKTCNDAPGEHGACAAATVGDHLDLLVVRVPSPLRRIEGVKWTLGLPANAGDLCIDAAQDLLVYVLDRTLCVRTLSTGAVHPLVIGHSGSFKMWEGNLNRSFDLCVCGDHVAAGTRKFSISIWNWKTGALVSDQLSDVTFSSFDFLDEHHILYADSSEDSMYVYDLRCRTEPVTKAKAGHLRFQLGVPPIHRATTSRYIQVRRNALPIRLEERAQRELHAGDGNGNGAPLSPLPPPFHVDPRVRLVVLRVVTSPVEFGEEQFELHVPAQALLDHFAAKRDAVLPWSTWCEDAEVTPARRLPYVPQARMITYGIRAVSHPPDWDEGILYLDSYLPRRAVAGAGATGARTRKGIPLPDESPGKANFMSVLCEDALLCYKLNPSLTKISHAYWFTP